MFLLNYLFSLIVIYLLFYIPYKLEIYSFLKLSSDNILNEKNILFRKRARIKFGMIYLPSICIEYFLTDLGIYFTVFNKALCFKWLDIKYMKILNNSISIQIKNKSIKLFDLDVKIFEAYSRHVSIEI